MPYLHANKSASADKSKRVITSGIIRPTGSSAAVLLGNIQTAFECTGALKDVFDTYGANYNLSCWELTLQTNSGDVVLDELRFPLLSDLAARLETELASQPADCIKFCLYDKLGTDKPPSKIYGQNRLISHLQGQATRYWPGGGRLEEGEAALRLLWEEQWGFALPATDWNTLSGIFWNGKGGKAKYCLPHPRHLAINGGSNRSALSLANAVTGVAGNFTTAPGATGDPSPFRLPDHEVYYMGMGPGGSPFVYLSEDEARDELYDYICRGYSFVVSYAVWNNNEDAALYIKAVGADTFFVDSFDPTKYRVEVVGHRKIAHWCRVRALSPDVNSPKNNLSGCYTALDICPVIIGLVGNFGSGAATLHRPGSAAFYFRNLETNCVTDTTKARINSSQYRLAPFAFLVENHIK